MGEQIWWTNILIHRHCLTGFDDSGTYKLTIHITHTGGYRHRV